MNLAGLLIIALLGTPTLSVDASPMTTPPDAVDVAIYNDWRRLPVNAGTFETSEALDAGEDVWLRLHPTGEIRRAIMIDAEDPYQIRLHESYLEIWTSTGWIDGSGDASSLPRNIGTNEYTITRVEWSIYVLVGCFLMYIIWKLQRGTSPEL